MEDRGNVGTLLALLDRMDAAELVVLLEPENLVRLLEAEGLTPEQIQAERRRKLPGALLLELLNRGRSPVNLVRSLGLAAVARVDAERRKKPTGATALPTPKGSVRRPKGPLVPVRPFQLGHKVGLALVLIAGLMPALFGLLEFSVALLLMAHVEWTVACIGAVAGLGGFLFARGRSAAWAGVLGGALAGVGGFGAVVAYALQAPGMGRLSITRLELVVAFLVGTLPGVLTYLAASKINRRGDVDLGGPQWSKG